MLSGTDGVGGAGRTLEWAEVGAEDKGVESLQQEMRVDHEEQETPQG